MDLARGGNDRHRQKDSEMILKLQSRNHSDTSCEEVEYLTRYDRISAKVSIGGNTDADITLGVQHPEGKMQDIKSWDPMRIMGWRTVGSMVSEVDIIDVHLYQGDKLWLMNDEGGTIDRLF